MKISDIVLDIETANGEEINSQVQHTTDDYKYVFNGLNFALKFIKFKISMGCGC